MDWKQQAWLWFSRAAQVWLVQTIIFYLAACVIAETPIGPKNCVRLANHAIQWHPPQAPRAPVTAYAKER